CSRRSWRPSRSSCSRTTRRRRSGATSTSRATWRSRSRSSDEESAMKVVSAALALVLFLQQQDDEAAKKARRVDRAIEWLAEKDLEVREMGRKDLIAIGPDVVPILEKKVAEKGASELVQMLRHFDKTPSIADAWVAEKELKDIEADEEFRKAAGKLSKSDGEKYLYVKYQ